MTARQARADWGELQLFRIVGRERRTLSHQLES